MQGVLLQRAIKLNRNHKQRKWWQRVVRTMAMIVVFCTTYALILPAITMEKETLCGKEVHTHGESCYEKQSISVLECGLGDGVTVVHSHGDLCRDAQGLLICPLPEVAEHIHGEGCHDAEGTLLCQEPQLETHTHTESCLVQTEQTILICQTEEHTHVEACFPEKEEEDNPSDGYICGLGLHSHVDTCRNEAGELVCTIPEHAHDLGCIVQGWDPTADVETEDRWAQSVASVAMTGDWDRDLLAVAKTQLGYRESEKNVAQIEGDIKGYTRYGAWYGAPYGDWNSMFASFCLYYAQIPEEAIPYHSHPARWYEQLQTLERITPAGEGLPEPGDLVFIADGNGEVQHAAIVAEVDGDRITVIEGDVKNEVVMQHYAAADPILTGFCAVKPAQKAYTVPSVDEIPETEDVTTPTEETQPEETVQATQPSDPVEPVCRCVETENYIVTVTYPADLVLPDGAELRSVEYSRDSEVFRRRCEEAGYELEWLLNIGFFLGDTELELNSDFKITVTSKNGTAMGRDITHFNEMTGAERITGQDATEKAAEGQTAVAFQADSFSDFGGGVAPVAEPEVQDQPVLMAAANSDQPMIGFSFVTANPAQLQENVDYVVYTRSGDNCIFLRSDLEALQVTISNDQAPYQVNGSWAVKTDSMQTDQLSAIAWRIRKSGNRYYLISQGNGQQLELTNGWRNLAQTGTALQNTNINGAGCYVGDKYHLRHENGWRATWENNGRFYTYPGTIYFAAVTPKYYPKAVETGDVTVNRLRFYNICEDGENGIDPLAGCVFEIKQIDDSGNVIVGGYSATLTSTNHPEIDLPANIPDGHYQITETSVPEGHMRDTNYIRIFRITGGILSSDENIGTFINHHKERLRVSKTGEVEDYNSRIYQILLSAESHMRVYKMDPVDVLFVVDQSNSMLFPSGLNSTGKSVTLKLDGSNNVSNMDALNLDKNKVHYIISDPQGTSTVWALYHDGSTWLYQDASYYAKAWYDNAEGYKDPSETAIFPENRSYNNQKNAESNTGTRSNGGGLGYSLSGSGLGNHLDGMNNDEDTFVVYTATTQYNRLHYLEEALVNMVYQLADVSSENRVAITEFTKEVNDTADCMGPLKLTSSNVDKLVAEIRSINTSGGTRQDFALEHVYENHLSNAADDFTKGVQRTYTILVTDGAPVISGTKRLELGSPSDPIPRNPDIVDDGDNDNKDDITANNNKGVTVYSRIKYFAQQVRTKSSLMTVSLGMQDVAGGSEVLENIASNEDFYCPLNDAADLVQSMQDLLFDAFKAKEAINVTGNVTDEISDSFYPIAWLPKNSGVPDGHTLLLQDDTRDWILLQAGDWIGLDGQYSYPNAWNAKGQLQQKEDGTFYIQWKNVQVSDPSGNTGSNYKWDGTFYVKAKEDFIGGNAIDTNKSAVIEATAHHENNPVERISLPTPTVNVHLLDMNVTNSEVTVYLGDIINETGLSPLDSVKYFYNNTHVKKILTSAQTAQNKVPVTEDNPDLTADIFTLRYAMGRDLTEEEWTKLVNGEAITIPYTYDDASSHGPVGEFTFRLTKSGINGATPDWKTHEATAACQLMGAPSGRTCQNPAETYVLTVSYTAYELGEGPENNARPAENVHNGSGSPGTEVSDTVSSKALNEGYGIVEKNNIHEVHVISGRIEITKRFAQGITSDADQTFTFTLHREEDLDNSRDVTKTITIPAGAGEGSATIQFNHLRRGTYTVTEQEDLNSDFVLKEILVLDTTNCHSTPAIGGSAKEVTFLMGNTVATDAAPAGENVISHAAIPDTELTETYTSYTGTPNGVYGAAVFVNQDIAGEIPVAKLWGDGNDTHVQDEVFVVLYLQEGEGDPLPVTVDGQHRILRLDAANNWQGSFKVPLKDRFDKVTNYNYSVREVSKAGTIAQTGWLPAVLENDRMTVVYYEKVLEDGSLLSTNTRGYVVHYTAGENGAWTVENHRGIDLPKTGGIGTQYHTFGGLLLIAFACVYSVATFGRKRQKGGAGRR